MRLILLSLHIAGGIIGLLSGTLAMALPKGSRGHRAAGNLFVITMLIMGACGSTLAFMKHQMDNVFGGLLTFYMIATAWLTGRRHDGRTGALDWGALVFGLSISASLLTLGTLVARGQVAASAGVPLEMYFFMGAIPLLAAIGDLRMLLRGGISGSSRLARHLWRMCFGLFIATGSFFLGKQELLPVEIRKQYLLVPLAIWPLVLLIYWLLRVSFAKPGSFPIARREGSRL